jgi:hypothetical protein
MVTNAAFKRFLRFLQATVLHIYLAASIYVLRSSRYGFPFFLDKKRGEKNQAPEFKFTQNIGMPYLPRNQCSAHTKREFFVLHQPSTWLLALPTHKPVQALRAKATPCFVSELK